MATFLALLAAVCFALAAALQQRGQFALARRGDAVDGVGGLVRLLAVPVWLLGTVVLLLGYATQGAALDRGRLVVVQPLLVTTIVWALPLGYALSAQTVVGRQVLGAGVVVVGLALFVLVGDPDAGVDNASTQSLVLAVLIVSSVAAMLLVWQRAKTAAALRAAVLGVCAGLFFGLSAVFTKPVLNDLRVSVGEAAGDWRTWALLGFGFVAFLIQQLSLATGQLAPAMAAVSVSNPAVSVLLGILLYEERLTRPGWHVVVAVAALLSALAGAVLITLANHETEVPDGLASDQVPARERGGCVTIEVVLLALASTVRPTSLAAVYALVSSESPRRLMILYITAGLTFTMAFGLLVIWAFNGVDINSGSNETKGIAELVGGIVALTFALLLAAGHIGGPHADDAPHTPGRWKTLLERRLSPDTAALAGPATHIPGLFYLIALNVIAAHHPSIPDGLVEVVIYNAVWFALPIGALAICVIDPPAARRAVDTVRTWTLRHTHTLLLIVSLVAGTGLVIRGLVTI